MGTWSVETFGNDRAGDWACELAEADDDTVCTQTLNICSCKRMRLPHLDVKKVWRRARSPVPRLKGQGGKRDASRLMVDDWVESHPQIVPERMIAKAIDVIDRITREPSELLGGWTESDNSAWRDAVADLRLRASP